MTAPTRLAVIGAGRWGRACINAVCSIPELSLAAVASRNPETRSLVPKSCVVTADWREIVARPDVDGVLVVTPPSLHAEIALAALEAGKGTFIEKPLTLDAPQARGLLEAARRLGRPVLIDHVLLFHPAYQELKRRAAALGPVRRVDSSGANWGPFRPDTPPLWDYAPHDLSLCLDLVGQEPKGVRCQETERRQTPEGLAASYLLELEFPSGARAALRIGNAARAKQRRFSASFDAQTLVFDDLSPHKLAALDAKKPGAERRVPVDAALPLTRAIETFAAQLREGRADLKSLELGALVVEILAGCQPAA